VCYPYGRPHATNPSPFHPLHIPCAIYPHCPPPLPSPAPRTPLPAPRYISPAAHASARPHNPLNAPHTPPPAPHHNRPPALLPRLCPPPMRSVFNNFWDLITLCLILSVFTYEQLGTQ
jgi:hypothetical protein